MNDQTKSDDELEPAGLCMFCARDGSLKRFLEKKGSPLAECPLCKARHTKWLPVEDLELPQLFKALIRYHFHGATYDVKWGGVELEELFLRPNLVLEDATRGNGEFLRSTVKALTHRRWEKPDSGVSLCQNDGASTMFGALREGYSGRLDRLQEKLEKQNYYVLEGQVKELLRPYVDGLQAEVVSGTRFYRARAGYSRRLLRRSWDLTEKSWYGYFPYRGDEIGAPPPNVATPGRMNRQNVSFLYVADSADVAIAELRPDPGEIVSVGAFQAESRLNVADLVNLDFLDYFRCDNDLDRYGFLVGLGRLFSAPVVRRETYRYAVTQLLADVLRQLGFDGISFRSSQGYGANFTFFDPSALSYCEEGLMAVEVTEVICKHRELPLISPEHDYLDSVTRRQADILDVFTEEELRDDVLGEVETADEIPPERKRPR